MTEYVGFDVSREETAFCVKDAAGKVLAQGKAATEPQALFEALKEHRLCPARVPGRCRAGLVWARWGSRSM